ncbi:hypothetical protein FWD07_03105 [Candidatus Saccharibacteria bacterium]|nr:hypothetical protein [Candidatus Saccharibacteria bacterium]
MKKKKVGKMKVQPDEQVSGHDAELAQALADLEGGTPNTEVVDGGMLPAVQADDATAAVDAGGETGGFGAIGEVPAPVGEVGGEMGAVGEVPIVPEVGSMETPVEGIAVPGAEIMGAAGEVPVEPVMPELAAVEVTPVVTESKGTDGGFSLNTEVVVTPENQELEDVKARALMELKPLVDRLDLNPQERFEIYLLTIRSSDDRSLVELAFDAARQIEDEDKKARALLDIIKEIDHLERQ